MHQLSVKFYWLTVALSMLFLPLTVSSQDHPDQSIDIEYSEPARLATQSLMLDITAISGGGFVAVGERGHIIHSASGETWQQAEVVPTRSTLTSVMSLDGRIWAAGHDSVILTSSDAGLTWTRLYFDPERQQPIMDLSFSDPDNGVAIGAYGLALTTNTGGLNWSESLINDEEWHNNALLRLNNSDIMVAGEAGFSYRSRDGGNSWETLEMPYPGSMFGIVNGRQNCLLVYGLRGHVQQSCDFGETWAELASGTQSSIFGAIFTGNKTIMVGNSGLILTLDSDGTFHSEIHSSGVDFAAIVATGDGQFLLAGEHGIHRYPETSQAEQ